MFWRKKPKKSLELDKDRIPKHIAIIMDGNGRWAKKRALPRNFGHKEGADVLKKISNYCNDIGVKYLTMYAFSTENWKRPPKEVEFLMDLLLRYLKNAEKHIDGKNLRFDVIGDIDGLSVAVQKEVERVRNVTKNNTGLQMNLAINYGSRDEIKNACKKIALEIKLGKLNIEDISIEKIEENLYTKGIPDPDLLIRPSGEKRISNYLLWQCAYTELYFTDVLWPDFTEEHLYESVLDYQNRNRRFGGI